MEQKRNCDNCGCEFLAHENMFQVELPDGNLMNDLVWETTCSDCEDYYREEELQNKTDN